jgi:hypothetical protein
MPDAHYVFYYGSRETTTLEPIARGSYSVMAIDPGSARFPRETDDAALRGISLREFLTYLRCVRRFIDERLHSYDIVLEKSWLLSGYLTVLCQDPPECHRNVGPRT